MAVDITHDLRAWALKGAEQRLVEIAQEAAAIHRAFPELRDRTSRPAPGPSQPTGAEPQPRRRRRKGRGRNLSPEGRSRIAEAARRRWAEWKAGREQPQSPGPATASKGRAPKKR